MKNLIPLINDICLIFKYPSEETINYFKLNNSLLDLETEYIRLFVNNFDESIISLYASTYLKPIPVEHTLEKLNKIISATNLQLTSNERMDHITIIFELLGILIESGINENILQNFILSYILCFKPLPLEIKNRTDNLLYITGAEQLVTFFDSIGNIINE